jgi:hypothetical protein
VSRLWRAALLCTGAAILAGCAPLLLLDRVAAEPGAEIILERGHPVGQTFVARHAGLSGIDVWIEPLQADELQIDLHLRSDSGADEDLALASLDLPDAWASGFHHFELPVPLSDSHGRYYYVYLELAGGAPASVGTASGESYQDGALYKDHEPLDAQMAFRLAYDTRFVAADLAGAVLEGAALVAAAGILCLLPGWALLAWLAPGWPASWPARLGVAVGLSLAIYPILFLWTDLVGLRLGFLYACLPAALGALALIWRYRAWRPRGWRGRVSLWLRSDSLWPDVAFLGAALLVLAVRLLAVRSLDAPLWGDSYQHTVMAQLLVDRGGLFDSWEPYAPLQSFTYHFGFHAEVAAFHWVTGMEVPAAVLWFGQLLNGLAVLALYPLGARVSGSRWGGVGAVVVAGFLSPMPMSYLNWGRYTQLAGQAVLPAAVVASWCAFERDGRDWPLAALAWICVGGLALTHYRVLVFYVVFTLAWALVSVRALGWRRVSARLALVAVGSLVLFLPWFVRTFSSGHLVAGITNKLTTAAGDVSAFHTQYNAIGDIASFLPPAVWLLLLVGLGALLWRRHTRGLAVSVWWLLLLVVTNPAWLGLPGTGAITNFALFIAAYIFAAVIIGALLHELVVSLERWRWTAGVMAAAALALCLLSAPRRLADAMPEAHALVTRPDVRAMEWIDQNVPEDARFLVNSFFAYGGSAVVGSDAGWWLPVLAERSNTVPPLPYTSEEGPWSGYREWVNELTWQLQQDGADHPATLAMLQERGITYVYVGQRRGRVNYQGPDVLDPQILLGSLHYRPAYHCDRVWVFEVVR